ncbi:MAG: alpha/beta fold hydrolase [Paramuribaculum sp.]|nr:alpha/beta fold hydrolase [Paramuribaculum sp.]
MRRLFVHLFSLLCSITIFAEDSPISGSWSGKLELRNGKSLKLVFHISDEGQEVILDSPDQGVKGIPLDMKYISDDSLNCTNGAMLMSFSGKLKEGKIEGSFFQRGVTIPLTLSRGEVIVKRPQTPVLPFPYTTEEVQISNDSVSLSGTLTIPENADKNTPVIIMITGSGLQNRDGELFEHKPFAVIADFLARQGIASLRYDDRGFGKSTGDVLNATTADFADDARMALEWIQSAGRFGKTGVLGHSEGGQIAYILGAEKSVDYIISVAGPAIPGTQTIAYQNKNALLKSGVDEKTAADFAEAIEKGFNYKITHPEKLSVSGSLIAELYPQYKQNAFTMRLAETLRQMLEDKSTNPWMMYFLAYNPKADMTNITVPALIIYGEKDKQVPPSLNLVPAREYLPSAKIICYPELNHLMQHSETGDVEEYSTIEETISPQVLSDIATFINSIK